MEWKDQYKHPKWQRKRLDALSKQTGLCDCCRHALDVGNGDHCGVHLVFPFGMCDIFIFIIFETNPHPSWSGRIDFALSWFQWAL